MIDLGTIAGLHRHQHDLTYYCARFDRPQVRPPVPTRPRRGWIEATSGNSAARSGSIRTNSSDPPRSDRVVFGIHCVVGRASSAPGGH